MKNISVLALMVLFGAIPTTTFAHPGNTDSLGCHTCRTNCPSWGLSYGEYHCHNSRSYTPVYQPIFIPSSALSPKEIDVDFTTNKNDTCNQDTKLSWDVSGITLFYKLSASKTPSDPRNGPYSALATNGEASYIIQNLSPGSWYINIVGGNASSFADQYTYMKIDVPEVTPSLDVHITESINGANIDYQAVCLDNFSGPQHWIDDLNSHPGVFSGSYFLSSSEITPGTLAFSAVDRHGQVHEQYVTYRGLVPIKNNTSQSENEISGYFIIYWICLSLLFITGVILKKKGN